MTSARCNVRIAIAIEPSDQAATNSLVVTASLTQLDAVRNISGTYLSTTSIAVTFW